MITELNKYQENKIQEYYQKYLEIGRDCNQDDKSCIDTICKLYNKNKLKNPVIIIWDCPICAFLSTSWLLTKLKNPSIDSFAWSSIKSSIESSIESSIWLSIDSSIESSIDSSIESSIESSIWLSIDSSIKSSIRLSVDSSIWSDIDSSIWSSIRSSIWSSIDSSINSSIRPSVWSSIWSSIDSSVWSSIDSSIWSSILYAQHSVGWVGYYSYFYEVLNLKNNVDEEYYNILQNMTKMHWFLLYANYCGIIRKPLYVKQNDRFQLHSENSPVIKYRSGWEIYALHGILMPKEIVMTSADKLDPKLIFKEKNVDIRREIIRKIGIERLISKLGAKSIEKNDNYELLNFDIIDGRYRPFLKMRNPSVDTWHIEGVHPSCDTIEKALAWRDGEEVYERPGILT